MNDDPVIIKTVGDTKQKPNNTLKSVLRWIILIPCSLGAFLAVQVALAFANSFVPLPLPDVIIDIFCQWANSIAGPVALMHVAVTIAPSYKLYVSIVTASLFILASLVLGIMGSINAGFSLSLIWVWVSLLFGMLAALVYHLIYQDQVKEERAAKLCPHQKEWFECAICAREIAGK